MSLPNPNEIVFRCTRDILVREFDNVFGKIGFQLPNLDESYDLFTTNIGEKIVTSLEERGALEPSTLIPIGSIDLSVMEAIRTELTVIAEDCKLVREEVEEKAQEQYEELHNCMENAQSYISDAESEMGYQDSTLEIADSNVEVRIDALNKLIGKLNESVNSTTDGKDETSD